MNFFLGLAAALDCFLFLWERGASELNDADTAALQKALALLGPYSAALLVMHSQSQLLESRLATLRGQPARARRKAESALALALQMRLPYEEAQAHEQLGRILRRETARPNAHRLDSGNAATEHLRRAVMLFNRFGDRWRAQRIELLLNG